MIVEDLKEILKRLQDNGIIMGLYKNSEEKFLISKNKIFPNYSLPCTFTTGEDSISNFLEPIMQNEFQLVVTITNYIETVRAACIKNNNIDIANIMCVKYQDYKDYIGKPIPELKPSGDYTDIKYVTYEEAVELYKNNQLSEYSMYCIERGKGE